MKNTAIFSDYRYPAQIISHAVWLYHRFTLSFRDIDELLAARGVIVSHETIRNWCQKFGQSYCKPMGRKRGHLSDTRYLDKVFIKINGVTLSMASHLRDPIGPDGDETDSLVQKRKDANAAKGFPIGC